MKFFITISIYFIFSILPGAAMSDLSQKDYVAETKLLKEKLEKVFKAKRIYFGHQSVGNNIVEGAQNLLDRSNIDLNILKIDNVVPNDQTGLFHSKIGENEKPYTKLNQFDNLVASNDSNIDYASMKFCFIDISRDTDVEKLFNEYKHLSEKIVNSNPGIKLIHFTIPLMTVQENGFRSFVKRLIGKPLGGYDTNILRNKFNDMLRTEYAANALFFDIAKLESTLADGTQVTFEKNGEKYQTLAYEYTMDGGHLNDKAKDYIGYEFLRFLADLDD